MSSHRLCRCSIIAYEFDRLPDSSQNNITRHTESSSFLESGYNTLQCEQFLSILRLNILAHPPCHRVHSFEDKNFQFWNWVFVTWMLLILFSGLLCILMMCLRVFPCHKYTNIGISFLMSTGCMYCSSTSDSCTCIISAVLYSKWDIQF